MILENEENSLIFHEDSHIFRYNESIIPVYDYRCQMKRSATVDLYKKHYADFQFERLGLFQAIKRKFGCADALYPGSYVHITPSLVFPRVVYVDRSPVAGRFFGDHPAVFEYVNGRKTYEQPPHFRFISGDYTKPLSLQEQRFDLLISLNAGGVARTCKRYLKFGGILVTNNHRGDALEAAHDAEYGLIAVLQHRCGTYALREDGIEGILAFPVKRAPKGLRPAEKAAQAYCEDEVYAVFTRQRKKKAQSPR
jgi:hypothetical protein